MRPQPLRRSTKAAVALLAAAAAGVAASALPAAAAPLSAAGLAQAAATPAPPALAWLYPGQQLHGGQAVASPDGAFKLVLQRDDNLVEYHTTTSATTVVWATNTFATGSHLVMQGDGNLVLYSGAGRALWNAGTWGHAGAAVQLDDGGELTVFAADGARLWQRSPAGLPSGLAPGQRLSAGQAAVSPDGYFQLVMQGDGNLVEYLRTPDAARVLWASHTFVRGSWAQMEADGDLAVVQPSGQPVWASGTAGHSGAVLRVDDGGDLVVASGSTTDWQSHSDTLGTRIVAAAASQNDFQDQPSGSYCNFATTYWGTGSACANGLGHEEAWCADFAAWAWQQAGVPFSYGWSAGDIDAAAASFYSYGVTHNTWHPAGSGYVPQAGDVAVFGLSPDGSYADHAAVVVSRGRVGADVVNGDWWSTGDGGVIEQNEETTATGTDVISGYASPASAPAGAAKAFAQPSAGTGSVGGAAPLASAPTVSRTLLQGVKPGAYEH